jgi:hypothetical protein
LIWEGLDNNNNKTIFLFWREKTGYFPRWLINLKNLQKFGFIWPSFEIKIIENQMAGGE